MAQQATAAAPRAGRREWIGLAVISLACLLYVMDLSVLYLAVPSLTRDLAPSATQLLWITDIYGFLVAGFLITMGTLGDRLGRRRILLIGAAAFGAASILAAFSSSAAMLIASRAVLGVAGATIAPSTLSLIRNMFVDPHQRTSAIGIWGMSFAAGGAIGPIVGGVMLQHFWWGSVFLINVPVMAALLVLGPRLLPEFRDKTAGRPDLLSVALSLGAVLPIIYGLKQVAQTGVSTTSIGAIVAGLFVGGIFVRRQSALDDPLIDLALFRNSTFTVSVITNALGGFIAFGTFLYMAQYLQLIVGLSPLAAGVWSLPPSLAVVAGSVFAPSILRRINPVNAAAGALAVVATGLTVLTQVGSTGGVTVLVIGSTLFAAGLGPIFVLTTDLIVGSAPPERAGAASAISETGAEFGGALGIAILGTIGTAVYRGSLTDSLPSEVPAGAAEVARDTLGGAIGVAQQLPESVAAALTDAAHSAFAAGLHITAGAGAVIALVMAGIVLVKLRGARTGGDVAGDEAIAVDEGALAVAEC